MFLKLHFCYFFTVDCCTILGSFVAPEEKRGGEKDDKNPRQPIKRGNNNMDDRKICPIFVHTSCISSSVFFFLFFILPLAVKGKLNPAGRIWEGKEKNAFVYVRAVHKQKRKIKRVDNAVNGRNMTAVDAFFV